MTLTQPSCTFSVPSSLSLWTNSRLPVRGQKTSVKECQVCLIPSASAGLEFSVTGLLYTCTSWDCIINAEDVSLTPACSNTCKKKDRELIVL